MAGESFGRYRLVDDGGSDVGSGVTDIRAAIDTEGGQGARIEILREGMSPIDKARFATRARRLSQVRHPHVLAVLEAATSYCAFEAPDASVLSEHAGIAIARTRQKLAWLAQIAAGLASLHDGGIAHSRFGLEDAVVTAELKIKIVVPLGASDPSALPLDDVRAFGRAACDLVLGTTCDGVAEPAVAERLAEASVPMEAAALLARTRLGQAITAHEVAERLAPFADYSGPTTERLLPIS